MTFTNSVKKEGLLIVESGGRRHFIEQIISFAPCKSKYVYILSKVTSTELKHNKMQQNNDVLSIFYSSILEVLQSS